MWILVPGEYIQMTLEKSDEGWWDCLLVGEGKIDLDKIDAEISFTEMSKDEQQLIRKMMADQQMKAEEPSGQVAEPLKTGWTSQPSPFNDIPYDPAILERIQGISHTSMV